MGRERVTNSIASSTEMLEFRRILHRPMDYHSTGWRGIHLGLGVQSTVVPDIWMLTTNALSPTQEHTDDKKEGCES